REYLAGLVLDAAIHGRDGLDAALLDKAGADPEALERLARDLAAPRDRGGYEKGIHDPDGALPLHDLRPIHRHAGGLRDAPAARALALLCWQQQRQRGDAVLRPERAVGAEAVRTLFGSRDGLDALRAEIAAALAQFATDAALPIDAALAPVGADYLIAELREGDPTFGFSRYARHLVDVLREKLRAAKLDAGFDRSLQHLSGKPGAQWALAAQWLQAIAAEGGHTPLAGYVPEAIALLLCGDTLRHRIIDATLIAQVSGL